MIPPDDPLPDARPAIPDRRLTRQPSHQPVLSPASPLTRMRRIKGGTPQSIKGETPRPVYCLFGPSCLFVLSAYLVRRTAAARHRDALPHPPIRCESDGSSPAGRSPPLWPPPYDKVA